METPDGLPHSNPYNPWPASDPGETFTVRADDGAVLFVRAWRPQGDPRAHILLLHGAGAHSGLYAPLAARLAAAGYHVVAPDLRGHGVSSGARGDVDRFERYLADLRPLQEHLGRPAVVWGESMGGVLALDLLLQQPHVWQAGVLMAPAIALRQAPDRAVRAMGRAVGRLAPWARGPLLGRGGFGGLPAGSMNDSFTIRWGMAVLAAGEQTAQHLAGITAPTLWLLPGADLIVDEEAVAAHAAQLADAEVLSFPGYPHALLLGPDPAPVIQQALSWLERRLQP